MATLSAQRDPFRRSLAALAPHRAVGVCLLAVVLATALLGAGEPLVMRYVIDGLVVRSARAVTIGVASLAGIALLREGGRALSRWLATRTRLRLHQTLTAAAVGRLHGPPSSFRWGEGMGAVRTRLDRAVQVAAGALTDLSVRAFPAIVYLVVSAVLLVRLDLRLAAVVLAFAPIPAAVAAIASPRQRRRVRALRERGVASDSGFAAFHGLATAGARVVALAIGGVLVLRHQVTLGTLVAVIAYLGGLFASVEGLSGVRHTLGDAREALRHVFEIHDAGSGPADVEDPGHAPGAAPRC
jgi:ATP-binding cassette subfamily B protein